MVKPFKLAWPVGHSDSMNKEDIENTKRALDALGLYEPPQLFTERFSTEPMIQGLKKFQRREGLEPDGVMNPDGPTHTALNRALADGFQGEPNVSKHGVFGVASLRSDSGRTFGPSRRSNPAFSPSQDRSFESEMVGRSERQIAAAPAIPFGVWLMEILGTATVALAMAIYNSWDKKRQNDVREQYERDQSDEEDYCRERWEIEYNRCGLRPWKWRNACEERAGDRLTLCQGNGGRPRQDEPEEWSERDEEVSRPRR